MTISRPSYQEIVDSIYADIISQTSFRADLDDSALGVLIKSAAANINSLWDYAEQVALQSNLFTAYGDGLDTWGVNLGVLRKTATQASSLGYSKPVRFTNLGSIQVTIPTGTRVWGSDPQLAFFTLEGINLLPGTSGEVHIRASDVGDNYNVPIGYINQHSFPASLSVTNILPIQEGSYRESDESYRSRLVNAYRQRVVFNLETCSEMLRGNPNVKDVIMINMPFGPGTFDAIIDPHVVSQLPQTLDACNALLEEFGTLASNGRVLGPFIRNLDVVVSLTFKPNSTNQQEVRNEIKAQIASVISALPIEDGTGRATLYIDQLRGIAQNSDADIAYVDLKIGLDGKSLNSTGTLTINRGEKFNLRALNVK